MFGVFLFMPGYVTFFPLVFFIGNKAFLVFGNVPINALAMGAFLDSRLTRYPFMPTSKTFKWLYRNLGHLAI